ncbi:MAG: hypothetical protein CL470_08315 [Acidimicrobiaceae bacterium]|nr:hypothetical protein [Acidimicrobiaceae bacterium]|tara:strand:+ start:460 stop:1893 length:1434 start_codon:yes stop_codon:yes gene_type:complete
MLSDDYPTIYEDPRDGLGEETGYYYCERCIESGYLFHPSDDEENDLDSPQSKCIRVIPCVICAMANGGAWGWKKGHKGDINYVLKSNGNDPGKSGIVDLLNYHSSDPYCNWKITDEEIVLGFIQNGLYQHYRWDEVIDIGEGPSRLRPTLPPTGYLNRDDPRYSDNWYWWKIIPYNVVLPKRLVKVLRDLLSDYCENDIPFTNQKKHESEYDETSWEYFCETFIEPAHVVHIFIKTLEKVLDMNRHNLPGSSTITDYHKNRCNIPSRFLSFYPEADKVLIMEWIHRTTSWGISNGFHNDYNESIHFLVNGTGDIFDLGYEYAKLPIMDRDLFGTTLNNVIEYDWMRIKSWNRDYSILESTQHPPSEEDLNKLWNTDNYLKLYNDVYKRIMFEDTSLSSDIHEYSDYDNEYQFRCILEESEYTENNENNERLIDSEGIIQILKNLQGIVEDDIKDHICENTYIQVQNNMRDIYRMVKL